MTAEEIRLSNLIAVLKVKRDAEPDPIRRMETQYEIYQLSQAIATVQRQERERHRASGRNDEAAAGA